MRGSAESQDIMMTPKTPSPPLETTATPADERRLLLAHREGTHGAFAALVTAYRRPVFAYLVRCGVVEVDRDDLFQEVFVQVHRAADQYDAARPLHPWLFTIVANAVRMYHRKRKVRSVVVAGPSSLEPVTDAADGERRAMARQTVAWLEHEIRELPLAQREVLILTCVENLPQKEVAEILDLPVNTIKTHLRRARLTLARLLAERNQVRRGEEPS